MIQQRIRPFLISAVFLAILLLAAYFRLTNVHDNPGWFTDEGTHLEVARGMLDGRTQYLAVQDSVLLFSRVPLFGRLLAESGRLFGLNMRTLRLLTGSLGVLSVGLVGLVGWRLVGKVWFGITAAFLLAIFPAAIIYSRFGFSYNLLAPLLLVVCLGLWAYVQGGSKRWLAAASLVVGLGVISDLWMVSYLPVLGVVVFYRSAGEGEGLRDGVVTAVWSVGLALLPFFLYAVSQLLAAPEAFLFDLSFVRARLSLSLVEQARALATNVTVLVSQNGWIALGFVGLAAVEGVGRRRFLLIFVLLPLAILGRSTGLHTLGFHYFIPFLPFVALGLAGLLWAGVPRLAAAFGGNVVGVGLAAVLVAVPLATTVGLLRGQVDGRFQTAIDPFLADAEDAEAVAAFINGRLSEDDLVIANATISWMLNTRRADFQMAIAAGETATPHLPADIPAERFAFDVDYRTAEMVVIDNWWYTWGRFNVPGLEAMMAEVESWPLVFSSGEMRVYRNPEPST